VNDYHFHLWPYYWLHSGEIIYSERWPSRSKTYECSACGREIVRVAGLPTSRKHRKKQAWAFGTFYA